MDSFLGGAGGELEESGVLAPFLASSEPDNTGSTKGSMLLPEPEVLPDWLFCSVLLFPLEFWCIC